MKNSSRRIMMTVVMIGLMWWVPKAFAEPYVGGYLGFASAADSDFTNVDLTGIDFTVMPIEVVGGIDGEFSTDIDTSLTFGLRAGYWFDFLPLLGTQFDFYIFSPDVDIKNPDTATSGQTPNSFEFDISVVAFGFSILGRYPFLKSPEFPRGRLQPYIGIGPAIFITSFDGKQNITDSQFLGSDLGSETVVNGGLQFLLGTMFFIRENISLFGEYKFTHHVTQISGSTQQIQDNPAPQPDFVTRILSISGSQPFNVSHFTFGATYHFY